MVFTGRTDTYDVIVVGNGALGLGTALRVAQARLQPLDCRRLARLIAQGAATMAAGAAINVWAEMAAGQFDNPALADRADLTIEAMPSLGQAL